MPGRKCEHQEEIVMSQWEPISEEALWKIWKMMNTSALKMNPSQQRLLNTIRIVPKKWEQHPYGEEGGGFWAVAVMGNTVLWYNDIEEGFNLSKYRQYGVIEDYWCNQNELDIAIEHLLILIKTGIDPGPVRSPPKFAPYRP